MASTRAEATMIVVLRILTILFAAGSIVVLILDKVKVFDVTFKDVFGYRYMLSTAVIAAAYCVLQLPFAVYYACTEKRLIRGDFLPAVDFYGDKVIAFLLASGVGAGIFVTMDLKEFLDDTPFESFFNKGYIAVGLLAGAFLCMTLLSIFSSPNTTPSTGTTRRGFFFR